MHSFANGKSDFDDDDDGVWCGGYVGYEVG